MLKDSLIKEICNKNNVLNLNEKYIVEIDDYKQRESSNSTKIDELTSNYETQVKLLQHELIDSKDNNEELNIEVL